MPRCLVVVAPDILLGATAKSPDCPVSGAGLTNHLTPGLN
jgi:hypothetical protein